MRCPVYLKRKVYIHSSAAVGGREEGRGAIGSHFDLTDDSDLFGMKSFERAEGEMSRIALNIALKKAGISPSELSLIASGDLQNQCVASSSGLISFGAPYIGLYGACSTFTESIITVSSYFQADGEARFCASVASSHNSAEERQYRSPLEYGGQRTPSSQWTATAGGAIILSSLPSSVYIDAFMVGKIIDGYTKDKTNMGAAMALSAFDTLSAFFENSTESPEEYDLILTGDLGRVGSSVLRELLSDKLGKLGEKIASVHNDAGLLLYDFENQDVHSGASGCGCSASVFSAFIFPKLKRKEIKQMLLVSTGALMSPLSINQGENIYGIAPLVKIKSV